MAFAVAHFLVTAGMMKLSKLRLDKTKFLSFKELFICALFGILLDVDIPFQAIAFILGDSGTVHQTYTHNIFIPILLFVIGLCLYKKKYASTLFFLASLATLTHVLLDLALLANLPLLAPFSWTRYGYACDVMLRMSVFMGLDAILLLGWLFIRWKRK